jgi:hypothetical protein
MSGHAHAIKYGVLILLLLTTSISAARADQTKVGEMAAAGINFFQALSPINSRKRCFLCERASELGVHSQAARGFRWR